jgi:hypothetical protein
MTRQTDSGAHLTSYALHVGGKAVTYRGLLKRNILQTLCTQYTADKAATYITGPSSVILCHRNCRHRCCCCCCCCFCCCDGFSAASAYQRKMARHCTVLSHFSYKLHSSSFSSTPVLVCPHLHVTRRFITLFTRAHHWTLVHIPFLQDPL